MSVTLKVRCTTPFMRKCLNSGLARALHPERQGQTLDVYLSDRRTQQCDDW